MSGEKSSIKKNSGNKDKTKSKEKSNNKEMSKSKEKTQIKETSKSKERATMNNQAKSDEKAESKEIGGKRKRSFIRKRKRQGRESKRVDTGSGKEEKDSGSGKEEKDSGSGKEGSSGNGKAEESGSGDDLGLERKRSGIDAMPHDITDNRGTSLKSVSTTISLLKTIQNFITGENVEVLGLPPPRDVIDEQQNNKNVDLVKTDTPFSPLCDSVIVNFF